MTSVIEDHTHNYGNIKGVRSVAYDQPKKHIANQSLDVCDTPRHGKTQTFVRDENSSAFSSHVYRKQCELSC